MDRQSQRMRKNKIRKTKKCFLKVPRGSLGPKGQEKWEKERKMK